MQTALNSSKWSPWIERRFNCFHFLHAESPKAKPSSPCMRGQASKKVVYFNFRPLLSPLRWYWSVALEERNQLLQLFVIGVCLFLAGDCLGNYTASGVISTDHDLSFVQSIPHIFILLESFRILARLGRPVSIRNHYDSRNCSKGTNLQWIMFYQFSFVL